MHPCASQTTQTPHPSPDTASLQAERKESFRMHTEWEGAGHIPNPSEGIGQNPHISHGLGGFNDLS